MAPVGSFAPSERTMTSTHTAIEAMTRQRTLSGVLGGYLYAALLVAGPWIFTVLGLHFLSTATCDATCNDRTIFRSIVIYNSMYALIVTSPLAFVSGRYVSEQLHNHRKDSILSVLVLSLAIFGVLSLAIPVPFYLYATTLDALETIASIQNAIMIGVSWLFIPLLGAFRAYSAVLIAFGAGALSMFVLGGALHDPLCCIAPARV